MPNFSHDSANKLQSCDDQLINLFKEVIKTRDLTVIEGYRNKEAQDKAFETGHSKLKYPNGKHNKLPSQAVDVAPYPVEFPLKTDPEWLKQKKIMQFCYFAGYVMRTAESMGIRLRWGGDWDIDNNLKENKFDDLVHFEIVPKN